MSSATGRDAPAWAQAQLAAAILAVDPSALGGVVLRAPAGPVRDAWLAGLRSLLPDIPCPTPWVRLPLHVQDERLLGGLDLAATLHAGRPVAQRGVLAEADGGIVVLAMAERVGAATAARLAAVLDAGALQVARDGVTQQQRCRIGVVALDEGGDDEAPAAALTDRLALWLDLTGISASVLTPAACDGGVGMPDARDVVQARQRLAGVAVPDEVVDALCAAAGLMGIRSMRAPLLALRVARALAALAARDRIEPEDAAFAARCVLGPRALAMPHEADSAPQPDVDDGEAQPTAEAPDGDGGGEPRSEPGDDNAAALTEQVLSAAAATLPAHLLQRLAPPAGSGPARGAAGVAGAARAGHHRGAPIGVRPGDPRAGQRLDLLATLRAAAPWQRLRALLTQSQPQLRPSGAHVRVRREDFRIKRFRQRSPTTVIFAVDASGSAALHRLAEAKGAVELLLADCYARRDNVAVLAFRGKGTELLLPPSRSLVRAKRSLADLPGGGGTPLASAIHAACTLAAGVRRRGDTPLAVLLTDGRANVALDGSGGRERAQAEALQAARQLRIHGFSALLLDTSPRPHPQASALAQAMGALYLPLPHADAAGVAAAVRLSKPVQASA